MQRHLLPGKKIKKADTGCIVGKETIPVIQICKHATQHFVKHYVARYAGEIGGTLVSSQVLSSQGPQPTPTGDGLGDQCL